MNTLLTTEQFKKLKSNGSTENLSKDHIPVVMLTIPFTECVWLLTEIVSDDPEIAFGLCDLGQGFPELGYIDLYELVQADFLTFNNPLFKGKYPISAYADAARAHRRIVWNEKIIKRYSFRADISD